MSPNLLIGLLLLFISVPCLCQNKSNQTYVDEKGIIRWSADKSEVHGFGVNYTLPFAHAYRSAQRMNVDVKDAIKKEIYHFKRLGFDLYRVHVWDTEISDTLGNLLQNEHLDAFDFLINELKSKGFNYVITPIAFWGNGWPEPDSPTPGFSHKYGKGDCLYNEDAIKAQENYLWQFINHVNPYTGIAYKDDPNVIAIEISNEPHHRGEPEEVESFVTKMVKAVKGTGTKKPILYNITHGVNFMESYFKAGIQGGTFQWYPAGLGYQQELSGNLLPNVNDYNIPFDDVIKKYGGTKIVYEFDAADVGKSYIYPAMARSFREAGIQIATHFAYEPTFLGPFNTEYNTHYMNLNYTPQKALSLMICSEVFKKIPVNSDYGMYPHNTTFGEFTVDYKSDLAIFNSDTKYYYTNNTKVSPKNESKLENIAGYGNSPIVSYDGNGAYFLDKLSNDTWRLEVMPDANIVANPYGRNSPDKIVGTTSWAEHSMTVQLKSLGTNFKVSAINEGNDHQAKISENTLNIRPGTYILQHSASKYEWEKDQDWNDYELQSYYAPNSNVTQRWYNHEAPTEITEKEPFTIKASLVDNNGVDKMEVQAYFGWKRESFPMSTEDGYNYEATIPAEKISAGYLNYYIVTTAGNKITTYPPDIDKTLNDWDFYDFTGYKVAVVLSSNPILLFDAITDSDELVRTWRRGLQTVPTEVPNEAEYQIVLEGLFEVDNENPDADPIYDYSIKHFIIDKIINRKSDLKLKTEVVLKGRSLVEEDTPVQIAFVMNNGISYGATLILNPETDLYSIKLSDLKQVRTVTLPRPYPSFLPYYLSSDAQYPFSIDRIESIQISIGPDFPEHKFNDKTGIGIRSIWLR